MQALTLAGELLTTTDTAPSQELAVWSGLVAWALPPLIAVFNQSYWPSLMKLLFTLASCIGSAAAVTAAQGIVTVDRWTTSALIIATGAVLTYTTAWRNIAKKIEPRTDIGAGRPTSG